VTELESCRSREMSPDPAVVDLCLRLAGSAVTAEAGYPPVHAQLATIGEHLLHWEMWEEAEHCAIGALKALPRFGAAFKLLGKSLLGAGFPDDAAVCHRYGLPATMREKHFSDVPVNWVESGEPIANSMTKKPAFPAESYPITPPRQIGSLEIKEFQRSRHDAREAYTTVITGGKLWFDGFNTVAWDQFGNIVRDLYRGYAEVVQGSLGDRQPTRLNGRVCLLGNRNAVNYYHWMHDILPRLEVLRASGESLAEIDYFVCNPIQFEFQRQTLAKLGIEPERLVDMNDEEYIEADELLVPVYGSNSLGKSQAGWNPAFYKREYLRGKDLPEPSLKLYVSRGSKGARGVVNDEEVVSYLERQGFTTVRAENLTVEEQADLFASASVVLGPHGAGFSNIVFCQPGTKVIELFNAHIVPCFHVISEQSDLEHYIHFCDVFDDESRPDDNEKYHRTMDARRVSPFRVELAGLDEILAYAGVE
nr:glycosyltransferase family 61 protein [Granulosicoccus sp.]